MLTSPTDRRATIDAAIAVLEARSGDDAHARLTLLRSDDGSAHVGDYHEQGRFAESGVQVIVHGPVAQPVGMKTRLFGSRQQRTIALLTTSDRLRLVFSGKPVTFPF